MSKPINVRLLVSDGKGGYRSYEELSQEERDAFGEKLTKRMGETLNEYFSAHIEEYKKVKPKSE